MQQLLDERIATRRGAMNAHREGAYPAGTWRASGPLVRSEEAQETEIVLPLFHQLTDAEQDRVIDAVKRAVARPPEH
jgi:dTDP-4-amino-4,6-dideoxygalactose transaminase